MKEQSTVQKKKFTAATLCECAIMVALASVLSLLKLVDLPYGGSITLASMLPITLLAYRHGLGVGLTSGLVFAIVQQLLGLKNLSYVTGWQSVVAVILLDYIVAFTAAGLGGVFRRPIKNQSLSLALGSLLVGVVRYICHVISGCTVWAGLSIPTEAALTYSLIYNATYMVPETIVMVLTAYYIGDAIDLSKKLPERKVRNSNIKGDICRISGGAFILAALIYDVVAVFSKVQNAESGEFDFTLLTAQPASFFITMGIVSVAGILLAVVCFALVRVFNKKKEQ